MAGRYLCGAAIVLFALSFCVVVDAGCYKAGKRPKEVTEKMTDAQIYSANTAKPSPAKSLSDLPKNFDWCNVNGKSYCSVSWNQHIPKYCGACWIHGALAAANDRIKLQLGGFHDNNLARQVILNCGEPRGYGTGCDGGESFDIFEYMHRYGLPDETCQNYVAEESPKCNDFYVCHNCMPIGEDIFPFHCWAVKPPIMYRVKEYGTVKGEAAMMSEILARGPITCGFVTTDEFDYNYRGGIYIDTSNSTDVNHDVEVVGWGEENGVKFWKARNSWGTYWGENGFFRILRGVNNAYFEDECVFALFDTSEVQNVVSGKAAGSMYGIYNPNDPHRLPTPVEILKYGEDSKGKGAKDSKVYAVEKGKSNSLPRAVQSLDLSESEHHKHPADNEDAEHDHATGKDRLTGDQIVQIVKAGTDAISDIVTGAEHMAENVAHPAANTQTLLQYEEGKPHHQQHHGHESSSKRSHHDHDKKPSHHHTSEKDNDEQSKQREKASEQGEQPQQKPWTADDVVKVIQAGSSGISRISHGGAGGAGDGGSADGKGSGAADGKGDSNSNAVDYSKIGKEYAKIGQDYADKFQRPQAAQGTQLDDSTASTDWAKKYSNFGDKYADKYANSADKYSDKYSNNGGSNSGGGASGGDYQSQYSGGKSAQEVGAKANVDEIKAAGKLSGQFMPKEFMKGNGNGADYSSYGKNYAGNYGNYAGQPAQQSTAESQSVSSANSDSRSHRTHRNSHHHAAAAHADADTLALRQAIVSAFVDSDGVDVSVNSHSDSHDEAQERATEKAIRDAIDAAFRSESADAKDKADKIHAAIVDAIDDIKTKMDEQAKSTKTQSKQSAEEIRNEIDELTQQIKKEASQLEKNTEENAKDLENKIQKLEQRQRQLQEQESQQSNNSPQQLIDMSAVADGINNQRSASASTLSWSVTFLVLSLLAVGAVFGYNKYARNSYQEF